MPPRRKTRPPELWQPHEMPQSHQRCPRCLGRRRVDRPCPWRASRDHDRAEAKRFANGWLVARFPRLARTMPRASYSR